MHATLTTHEFTNQNMTEIVTDSASTDDNSEGLMSEELQTAQNMLPIYASQVLIPVTGETPEDHKRAMLQSIFRLQLLRLESARLMADFLNLPAGTSIVALEDSFLRRAIEATALNETSKREMISAFTTTPIV